MALHQRNTEDGGIEFVNSDGTAVAGINSDGTFWGKGVGAAPARALAPAVDTSAIEARIAALEAAPRPSLELEGVQFAPAKDLASTMRAVNSIMALLHAQGS